MRMIASPWIARFSTKGKTPLIALMITPEFCLDSEQQVLFIPSTASRDAWMLVLGVNGLSRRVSKGRCATA